MTTLPLLSMLWESVDPADALTTRFGFADASSAVDWMGHALWDNWAIKTDRCERLVMSAGNLLAWIVADDRRLIAKWSVYPELFQRLADTASLIRWLHAGGIPVAAPIPATDGRLRVEVSDVSLGVYPVIDGDLLDVDDPAQVTQAGQMLARLHEALGAYPHRIGGGRPGRHEQLVHNDFRSANILRDQTGIKAVLDFEDVTYHTRVADLAQAAVLLGTRYHKWAPTTRPVREAFVSAYREKFPLTSVEENQIENRITSVLKAFGWA